MPARGLYTRDRALLRVLHPDTATVPMPAGGFIPATRRTRDELAKPKDGSNARGGLHTRDAPDSATDQPATYPRYGYRRRETEESVSSPAEQGAPPARSAAQRGRANRRRGHDSERALARWLRSNGFGQAERAVRTGFRTADRAAPDPGDITGTPGIVWSVKDCAAEQTTKWLAELEVMRAGAGALVGLLVHRRRGYADPGRWWCWTPLDVPVWLLTGYGGAAGHAEARAPVRMELTDVVALLRATGYGDPPEATP
jgi:hypothetical protein